MSVLSRGALEESPLADLHQLASELSIDGFRRLRREPLIEAILERQGGGGAMPDEDDGADAGAPPAEKPPRRRRTRRAPAADDSEAPEDSAPVREESGAEDTPVPSGGASVDDEEEPAPRRRRSRRGGGRGRAETVDADTPAAEESEPAGPSAAARNDDEEVVEGVVELLPNGSGFVRVSPPDPSDADVYISAAQVKRCELVSGDRVAGPRRAPRRSERFASLVRVDTVNGRPASELADGLRYEEMPAEFPRERIALGSEDPTLKALEFLTPIGLGSRVAIVGGPRAGKTELLRSLADALGSREELQVSVALAGSRPEEISEASRGERPPAAAVSFAASADAQAHAVELVVDQARRIAVRGANAVVLIDSLDGLHPHVARRIMAGARNLVEEGSVTIIAAASAPVGGETTVIALDPALTAQRRFPAIDFTLSGTLRPELLVGEEAAAAIARTRAEGLG